MRGKPTTMDYHTKKAGWKFYQPACASSVICAESKLPIYDEELFDEIRKQIGRNGGRAFFYQGDKPLRTTRKKTAIEIYKKYPGVEFEDKVNLMLQFISDNGLAGNED